MRSIPLQYVLRRATGRRSAPLRDCSIKSWTIHPSETQATKPAYFDEVELDLITSGAPNLSVREAVQRMRGKTLTHAATEAFTLKNAVLCGEALITTRMCRKLSVRGRISLRSRCNERISEAALAGDFFGGSWFGHWLTDDLPLHFLAESVSTPIIHSRPAYAHESEYRKLLNVHDRPVENVLVNQLTLFLDFATNSNKRTRLFKLRQRMADAIAKEKTTGPVYIVRGQQGSARVLVNENDIVDRLSKQGVAILYHETMSATEIAEALSRCSVVISIEGSHMAHAFYALPPNGKMLVIQPADRFCTNLRTTADCMDIDYGFTVATKAPGGYEADLDRLCRLVDLMS